MRNVLIVRFSSLGDVVLLTALIEALHRRHPAAQLWLATKAAYAPLFEQDPRLHQVIALARGQGALTNLVRQLEPVGFDVIYDAHDSLRSRVLTWRLPPAPVVRIRKASWARILFVRTRWRTPALDRHQIDRYLDMLGDRTEPCRPRLHVGPRRRTALAKDQRTLAIAPGARHALKQWGADRFAEVGRALALSQGARVIVVGGPGEEALCAQVAGSIEGAQTMAGDLELDRLAAVLQRCTSTLCNDSGLMHLSEAVDTPVLAVYGPTSRELGFFPTHPDSVVVEQNVPCRPCSRTGARPCHQPQNWCMTRSTPDLVRTRLEAQWQRILERTPATSI